MATADERQPIGRQSAAEACQARRYYLLIGGSAQIANKSPMLWDDKGGIIGSLHVAFLDTKRSGQDRRLVISRGVVVWRTVPACSFNQTYTLDAVGRQVRPLAYLQAVKV